MMLMHALVCAAMLPVLVVAERFGFGGCDGNFDNSVDPIANTEQGLQKLKEFASIGAAKMYLCNQFNKEKDQGIASVQLSFSPLISTFTLTYNKTGSQAPITTTGKATYQYLPKQAIMLNTTTPTSSLDGIFSFNEKGEADLYPLLITKTDLILRGCADAFMGRVDSLYVLTHQNYSGLDSVCARQTIKDKFDNWDVVVAT